MKKIRLVAMLMVISVFLMSTLSGCGAKEADVVGIWTGSWTYEGNSISKTLIVTPDHEYASEITNSSTGTKYETGIWEIQGGELKLHPNGNKGQTTAYKYKGGKLENNGHKMTKIG